jgi:hypothetical protein
MLVELLQLFPANSSLSMFVLYKTIYCYSNPGIKLCIRNSAAEAETEMSRDS